MADTPLTGLSTGNVPSNTDSIYFVQGNVSKQLLVSGIAGAPIFTGWSGQQTINSNTNAANLTSTGVALGATIVSVSGVLSSNPIPFTKPFNLNGLSWALSSSPLFFNNSTAPAIAFVDLQKYTGVRAQIIKLGNVGASTGRMWLGYNTTFSVGGSDYTNFLDSDSLRIQFDVANTLIDSGWHPIAPAAKASTSGVFMAIMGSGGQGSTTMNFGRIDVSFM